KITCSVRVIAHLSKTSAKAATHSGLIKQAVFIAGHYYSQQKNSVESISLSVGWQQHEAPEARLFNRCNPG
ncbi:MAG: hypothetical protein VW499_04820, partial [Candidatus Puniceispirillum sp.]